MQVIASNKPETRAMDVYDMVSLVSSAFYAAFDWTDDTYYWVLSVMIDNTLVAQDGTTQKLYKVGFVIDESNNITFDEKDNWTQVQKEYVPVEGRNFFVDEAYRANKIAEAEKRNLSTAKETVFTRSFGVRMQQQARSFSYDEESRRFGGTGIVFNADSEPLVINLNGRNIKVIEQISRASIEDADMSDVIAAYNHNFEKILARTNSGTLSLDIDDTGVHYGFEVPNTSYGNDLRESAARGDVSGSSFVFTIDLDAGYDIQERSDGAILAIPNKINRIMEIGPVVMPAYPTTTAENRSSALIDAVTTHIKQRNQETTTDEVSEETIQHYKAKLRHNEEAAK